MNLKDVLTSDADDLNSELRRAFRPLTPAIDISEELSKALIILVNLTDKVDKQIDLLSRDKCKKKLRDEKWWARCLNTAKYRQSHNVKFPDIRATGTIRAETIGELPEYLLSSSKLPKAAWAYSKDSTDVNVCMFLCAEFIWEGSISCLAILLQDFDHSIWFALKRLGCYEKFRKLAVKTLKKIPSRTIDVTLAPNYLKQISLPDGNDSYISLSPVASQALQSYMYQSLEAQRNSQTFRASRPGNMGLLPACCGGAFRMLKTIPFIKDRRHHYLNDEPRWLSTEAIRAMSQYMEAPSWLLPSNLYQKEIARVKFTIEEMVQKWMNNQTNVEETSLSALTEKLNTDLASSKSGPRLSYEPRLTKLLYYLINKLRQQAAELKVKNASMRYLLIPEIRVCAASAQSSSVTIGLPSMMGLFGFVHAFERNISKHSPGFKVNSFATCIHSYHLQNRGLTKEAVKKLSGEISPPAIYDDWQCDLTFSLLLDCGDFSESLLERVPKLLPKRLWRGKSYIDIDDMQHILVYSKATSAISAIPNDYGFWLGFDNHTAIEDIGTLVEHCRTNRTSLVTTVGYHLLEQPKERAESLRGYPHAFCETALGLIRPVTVTRATNINEIFWDYTVDEYNPQISPRSCQ
ncbi:type I-F CRISPR-associated protein Csy2 [Vibrio sp. RC27]